MEREMEEEQFQSYQAEVTNDAEEQEREKTPLSAEDQIKLERAAASNAMVYIQQYIKSQSLLQALQVQLTEYQETMRRAQLAVMREEKRGRNLSQEKIEELREVVSFFCPKDPDTLIGKAWVAYHMHSAHAEPVANPGLLLKRSKKDDMLAVWKAHGLHLFEKSTRRDASGFAFNLSSLPIARRLMLDMRARGLDCASKNPRKRKRLAAPQHERQEHSTQHLALQEHQRISQQQLLRQQEEERQHAREQQRQLEQLQHLQQQRHEQHLQQHQLGQQQQQQQQQHLEQQQLQQQQLQQLQHQQEEQRRQQQKQEQELQQRQQHQHQQQEQQRQQRRLQQQREEEQAQEEHQEHPHHGLERHEEQLEGHGQEQAQRQQQAHHRGGGEPEGMQLEPTAPSLPLAHDGAKGGGEKNPPVPTVELNIVEAVLDGSLKESPDLSQGFSDLLGGGEDLGTGEGPDLPILSD